MDLVKILLTSSLLSLLTGQILRFPFLSSGGAINATDVLVFSTVFVFLIYSFLLKKSFKVEPRIFYAFLVFVFFALSSTIFALSMFPWDQVLTSSFFLIRFVVYFLLSVVVFNVVSLKEVFGWLSLFLTTGIVFLFLGFLQFVLYSDLSLLALFGWDPHQRRVVSTILDPNFSGLIFVFLIAFSLALYLKKNRPIFALLSIVAFVGLVLTFSRSSYIAFCAVILIIGFTKSPKVILVTLLITVAMFIGVGKFRERMIGLVTLDETALARVESWKNGISILSKNFWFGVGFNTYRYAQSKYGFFEPDSPLGGHSGAGVDSSIILVAATTGIIGFLAFIYLLFSLFLNLAKNIKLSALKLGTFCCFIGLLVHSQFVNSFFFPQIMLIFWFLVGLSHVEDA